MNKMESDLKEGLNLNKERIYLNLIVKVDNYVGLNINVLKKVNS
jgi:hypothetical protein